MKAHVSHSLRARLLTGALIWIACGVTAAGVFVSAIFRQQATALVDAEMRAHIQELASLINVNPQGNPELSRVLSDPRFGQPGSGYSWQVSRSGMSLIKSTSVSAENVPIPDDQLPAGEVRKIDLTGTRGPLIVYETLFSPDGMSEPLLLQAEVDSDVVGSMLRRFNISLTASLVSLALVLIAAAVLQVFVGLQPMTRLGQALREIRAGKARHLPRIFPLEIQPVVDDLNTVIDVNAEMVVRARAQAGNLAHALRTPLAILTDEAYRLENCGQAESANVILQQCQRMERQIDYQIARTRAAASRSVPGVSAEVLPAAQNIVSAMKRLHAGRNPQLSLSIASDCAVLCDPMDLNEMLANLIDNACKWCGCRVLISAIVDSRASTGIITVEDDGPGLPAESREAVFQIGRRLDERIPGSGLGLPIVRDLAQLYGGRIDLDRSNLGGLKASLTLPCVVRESDQQAPPRQVSVASAA